MATITSYQSENSLLLETRESFSRPFDLGSWTELRMGMLFRFVGTSSETSSYTNENMSVSSYTDKVYFGLKNTGSNLPGGANTNFIGAASITNTYLSAQDVGQNVGGASIRLFTTAVSGSSTYAPVVNPASSNPLSYPAYPFTTDYDGFYGLKFILQNSGSVNQYITVSFKREINNNGSGSADLHTALMNESNWNSMGVPSASWSSGIPIPDCFFVYAPFYNNRIRMSAIEVVKIS